MRVSEIMERMREREWERNKKFAYGRLKENVCFHLPSSLKIHILFTIGWSLNWNAIPFRFKLITNFEKSYTKKIEKNVRIN